MAGDHPFAAFLRTVGRGPSLSRPLDRAESAAAMTMILDGTATPAQVGAFLLLLRFRGETAPEMAGFVEAARRALGRAGPPAPVDLDWPSYADRHRQQPWFVLAALLLAENGVRVLMHGIAGESDGYAPTRPVLERLGAAPCASPAEASARLQARGFAYLGLDRLCPPLHALFGLRPVLGVRTAVNSLARALNPFAAPCQLQGVFHPPYKALHRDAALLLGQPRAAIFKGGGGEAQRNPLKPCEVTELRDGAAVEETWPALLPGVAHAWREEDLDPARVVALWRGELELPAAAAAVTGTAALALRLTGRAATPAEAQALAETLWAGRAAARGQAA